MTTKKITQQISKWVNDYSFCSPVTLVEKCEGYMLEFNATTTKTRASSIVTRLSLIVSEIVVDAVYAVDKQLLGPKPETRSSLSLWRIFVYIPKKRKLAQAR